MEPLSIYRKLIWQSGQPLVYSHHWALLRQPIITLCWPSHTHTHTHSNTDRHSMSLWHKENWESPRDSQRMKSLSSKWLMYSARSPSGSALYWQSRMVKALVKVWDRTAWHSSHTVTWMTHTNWCSARGQFPPSNCACDVIKATRRYI